MYLNKLRWSGTRQKLSTLTLKQIWMLGVKGSILKLRLRSSPLSNRLTNCKLNWTKRILTMSYSKLTWLRRRRLKQTKQVRRRWVMTKYSLCMMRRLQAARSTKTGPFKSKSAQGRLSDRIRPPWFFRVSSWDGDNQSTTWKQVKIGLGFASAHLWTMAICETAGLI